MPEFMKLTQDDPMFLRDFPQACICGSQKGPIVATGITYRTAAVGPAGTSAGHVYLCRLCVTRAGRALGLLKGDEQTRLQNAADELDVAAKEIADRQAQIDELTRTNGAREQKIGQLQAELDRKQAEITHFHATINNGIALMKDAVAA